MSYDNPGGIIAASIILELIAVTCVGLRFLARRKKGVTPITSDWLILSGLVGATGLTVMEIYGAAVKALGVPLDATIEDPKAVNGRLNKAKHIELALLLLGIFTLGLVKLSVSFLYYRIFEKPIFRRVMIIWIAIIIAWTMSFVIAGLAECGSHLLSLFGTPQAYLARCGNAIPTGYAMIGSDLATDFITLMLPIPMVSIWRVSWGNRLLRLGSLSVGASIGKAYIYIKSSLGLYNEDAILIITGLSVWNLVEIQVGIIAACAPVLRPVLSDMIPRESIISLLDSLRNRLSSEQRSHQARRSKNSHGTRKLPSNENLPLSTYQETKSNVVAGNALALQRSSESHPKVYEPDEIHVRSQVAVERI
ncbi:MAG: hypothetical protein M1821_003940 [Bathelium mastoideum]|nr:MAG: hypothetical protein M1821_003940 [Bathelium mastoideum]